MKNIITVFILFCSSSLLFAQSPIGIWKTIDDETGAEKSHVQIYEQNGNLYGKVIKILTPGKENAVCLNCSGSKKNKPINGMIILENVKKVNDKKWDNGEILDPNKGKTYKVSLELENPDKLKVRGYVGFSLLGRTQYWHRVK